MKRLLCYGDSNTWGYDPATKDRLDERRRWTGVLSEALGDEYTIIEEGLSGRTTVWDDPIEGHKNGHTYLIPCLESHQPVDLVILMLGTNDLKQRFSLPACDIAAGARILVRVIQGSQSGRNGKAPPVLLLAPPRIGRLSDFAEMFAGAGEKSRQFSELYRRVATEQGCTYFDTSTIVAASELDGIHLKAGEHRKLGQALAVQVRGLLA